MRRLRWSATSTVHGSQHLERYREFDAGRLLRLMSQRCRLLGVLSQHGDNALLDFDFPLDLRVATRDNNFVSGSVNGACETPLFFMSLPCILYRGTGVHLFIRHL